MTILHGEYFPGAVTATVIVGLGAMIVASVWREFSAKSLGRYQTI